MIVRDPPAREHCLELMTRYDMLDNIKAHSEKVCDVSLSIARALVGAGVSLDLPLVEAGALLHDITKTRELKTHHNHAVSGRALLVELGYPRTAEIVGEHIIPKDRGNTLTPAEVVAYADKRVMHDRLVSLDERFVYLLNTYGKIPNARRHFDEMRRCMDAIERRIEQIAGARIDSFVAGSRE